jgi:ubiquinone biosynthesis O-methyltransferase
MAMSERRKRGGDDKIDGAISALPESYRRWRASELGRVTDKLERDLILDLCGDVAGLRVLDVGCGDGDLAAALGRAGAQVTGLDADPRMLRAAWERQASEVLSIRFVRGDVNALPFADRSFDVVTAITALCFVPDARTAMAEMTRVLKPGGRLVLGELGRYSVWAAFRRIKGWLGSATWRAARFRSAQDLRRLVEQAGLSVTTIRGAVFYPPVRWLSAMMAGADPALGRRTTIGAAFITVAATRASMTCIRTDATGLADYSNNPSWANDGRWS